MQAARCRPYVSNAAPHLASINAKEDAATPRCENVQATPCIQGRWELQTGRESKMDNTANRVATRPVPNATLWRSLVVEQINPTWSIKQGALLVTTFASPLKQLQDCIQQSWPTHLPTTPRMQLARTALPNEGPIRPFALAMWTSSLSVGISPKTLWPSATSLHHGLLTSVCCVVVAFDGNRTLLLPPCKFGWD